MSVKKICLIMAEFLTSLISSENIFSFWRDNKGGLVLPFSGQAVNDEDWLEYKRLKVDRNVKSINPKDLPEDFCDEACLLVDEFHRKTVNEKIEWVLYLDYKTGDVIYCWKGELGECKIDWYNIHLKGRNIVSIHNHTKNYYSFPSPDNFDILENDFEDYEIITSVNAFWIIEFKGAIEEEMRYDFQNRLSLYFNKLDIEIKLKYQDYVTIRKMTERMISEYLLNDIDKKLDGITLVFNKRRYD
ncbi:hypothetical protein [Methanobrevibacter sp.]|uniref:hypothetical protein n=1 Tax=Methanobrevibacter sp. TaxID=66852 RepID=UPI00386E64D2